jgi:GTP-binding protein
VEIDYESFVAADMPGLIEGASSGVGLGHEFLRHIERTRVLVHLLDMTREDPFLDRQLIDAELAAFGHGLAEKPQLLALNKIDHPDARAHVELVTEGDRDLGAPWVAISGLTGEGTGTLARRTLLLLREAIDAERREVKPSVLRPAPRRSRFTVRRDAEGVVIVEGPTPEWLAQTLDLSNDEARQELFQRLRRMGVARAVRREGVGLGDPVRIGTTEVRWEP